jgi:diphthamide biosynthesis protein 3
MTKYVAYLNLSLKQVEIEDMDFDEDLKTYFYPCPCGDRFQITLEEIYDGDEVGICPSCSLIIR